MRQVMGLIERIVTWKNIDLYELHEVEANIIVNHSGYGVGDIAKLAIGNGKSK